MSRDYEGLILLDEDGRFDVPDRFDGESRNVTIRKPVGTIRMQGRSQQHWPGSENGRVADGEVLFDPAGTDTEHWYRVVEPGERVVIGKGGFKSEKAHARFEGMDTSFCGREMVGEKPVASGQHAYALLHGCGHCRNHLMQKARDIFDAVTSMAERYNETEVGQ